MYQRRWNYSRKTVDAPAVTAIYPSRAQVRVRSTQPKKRTVNAVTRRRGPYWKASVKKIVQDTMSRTVEKKNVQFNPASMSMHYINSSNWPTNNVLRLTPGSGSSTLLQGTGQGQRIGCKVDVKKLMFNFVLGSRGYDVANNPTPEANYVRMVLFYERDFPNDIPNPTTNFFQLGSSSSAITGVLSDMIAPINTDLYVKLAERTFKIGFASYPDPTTGAMINGSNNDFDQSVLVKWDVTKYVPKKMLFSDNSADPTSRGLFVAIMISRANNLAAQATVIPMALRYWTDLEYTDC